MKTQLPSQQQQSLQVPQISAGKALLPADFHDSRPLATMQRRLQTLADNSQQTRQLQTVARSMQAQQSSPLRHPLQQKQLAGVMQQKSGLHRPRFQMKGSTVGTSSVGATSGQHQDATAQLKLDAAKLNVAGETHDESDAIGERAEEKRFSAAVTKSPNYWTEDQFTTSEVGEDGATIQRPADPPMGAIRFLLAEIRMLIMRIESLAQVPVSNPRFAEIWQKWRTSLDNKESLLTSHIMRATTDKELKISKLANPVDLNNCSIMLTAFVRSLKEAPAATDMPLYVKSAKAYDLHAQKFVTSVGGDADAKVDEKNATGIRNNAMHAAANKKHAVKGVWKIGEEHVTGIAALGGEKQYNLVTRADFRAEMAAFQDKNPRPMDCVIL